MRVTLEVGPFRVAVDFSAAVLVPLEDVPADPAGSTSVIERRPQYDHDRGPVGFVGGTHR